MKTVRIQYFAQLREERGLVEEDYATEAEDAAALYEELASRHGFTVPTSALCVAVNGAFAQRDARLSPGDVVVFLPPVAGG